MKGKLTPRQRMFVEAYKGNATEAAKAAGYSEKTAKPQGSRLLTNVAVREAIKRREDKAAGKFIKTRTQLQEFWSEALENESLRMPDRLKASELLGKSRGEFTQKVELKGELTLEALVRESMGKEASHADSPETGSPPGGQPPAGEGAGSDEGSAG